MRRIVILIFTSLLMLSPNLSAAENPARPVPRTTDYDWMSAATWREKHAAHVARAAEGNVDLLLLGDSITEGWSDTTLWADRFPNTRIANFGIGGDTTSNLLWRLENGAIGSLKPKLVVLLIGTNNLGRNEDKPAAVARGIQTIVGRISSVLPGTRIMVLGILPADQAAKTRMRKQIAKTNELLVKNLHNNHTVFVEDLGAALLETDGTIAPGIMADFLHPTPAGYARIADVLFPKVERMLSR